MGREGGEFIGREGGCDECVAGGFWVGFVFMSTLSTCYCVFIVWHVFQQITDDIHRFFRDILTYQKFKIKIKNSLHFIIVTSFEQ